MTHRGAESADNKTGDGSGVMLQLPHAFYHDEVRGLPDPGRYGMGVVFLPRDADEAATCMRAFERFIDQEGLRLVAWRDVPVQSDVLGDIARAAEPTVKQVFVAGGPELDQAALERKLYVVRKQVERAIRESSLRQAPSSTSPTSRRARWSTRAC